MVQFSDGNGGKDYKLEVVWINVTRMILLHVSFIVGLYYIFSGWVMLPTMLFGKKFTSLLTFKMELFLLVF